MSAVILSAPASAADAPIGSGGTITWGSPTCTRSQCTYTGDNGAIKVCSVGASPTCTVTGANEGVGGCPAGQVKVRQTCTTLATGTSCPTGQMPYRNSCISDQDYANLNCSRSGGCNTNTAPQSVSGSGLTAAPNYGNLHPDPNALPGGAEAQTMLGGLMFYAILFTLGGMMVSMGVWAVGSFSSNYTQAVNGKRSALICFGAAFFIGAAYALVNWFYTKGTTVS